VRTEDKELEGPDLERAERTQEETSGHAHEEEEELPALGGEELRDVELEHRSRLFEALRLILADEKVNVSLLYLPQRETHALEALQAAVSGQDSIGEFVFAEDRRSLLEQALAVLQQNVTYGEPAQIAELHGKFDELAGQIAELRDRLTNLEEAQEDLFGERHEEEKAEAGDAGDQDDQGDQGEGDRSAGSTLTGPELPAAPAAPSTLSGPELPAAPAAPSTLSGDALPEAPRPASTLGADDGAEAAQAEPKKPWWRRPFG